MKDLAALIKEQLVEALTDPRVIEAYGPYLAELYLARHQVERWIATAAMAKMDQRVGSAKYLLVLAGRHPELRALARPKPWEVDPGKKTPPLEWPVQQTLAWLARHYGG